MALTMLDPITALIIVDLQRGIVDLPSVHPMGDVVARASALVTAFRRRRLPVVLVNVAGGAPGRTDGRAVAVRSRRMDRSHSRAGSTARRYRRDQADMGRIRRAPISRAGCDGAGVTQVVIAGVATGTGVESTARQAYEAGFNVTLATDAMTDPRSELMTTASQTCFRGSARAARRRRSSICSTRRA